ncbi:MAG: hypothetical protein BMS9Abin19_0921 [Gammaproteobacteria bacterium]|nr:MAG: hypothetical protein BMS9Abin19_0921 [Gammaproteobacteria bacterium]
MRIFIKTMCCMLLLILTPLMVIASDQNYGAENLGQLFTSPQQRKHLDSMRSGISTGGAEQNLDISTVKLNGVMMRSDGKNVIWVNGGNSLKSNKVSGVKVQPEAVDKETYKVPVQVEEQKLKMKPGQSWSQTTSSVKDNY